MESLPLEIKKSIAAFVDDKTKRQLRLASSKWFKIIDYKNFTLYLTKISEWKQIVDRFEQYPAPISLRLKKCQIKDATDILEHLTRLTNLEFFKSSPAVSDLPKLVFGMTNLKRFPGHGLSLANSQLWKTFTQLECLNLQRTTVNISLAELTDLVSGLTNLQNLTFHAQETGNPLRVITGSHSKLTKLVIAVNSVLPWADADLKRLSNLRYFTFELLADIPKEKTPILSLKYLTALENLSSDLQFSDFNSTRLTGIKFKTIAPIEKQQVPKMSELECIEWLEVEEHMEYLTALTRLSDISLIGKRNLAEGQKYSILGNIRSSRLTRLLGYQLGESLDYGYLTQLDSIRHLYLEDTLCDENIAALTNLEQLGFALQEEFGDETAFLTSLSKLTKLRVIQYSPNTERPVTVYLSTLTNLESLALVLDPTFMGFEVLTKLTRLELIGSHKQWKFPFLANLTNLKSFSFDADCDFFTYITALTGLQRISLYGCYDDEALEAFTTSLLHLTHFSISRKTTQVRSLHLTRLTRLQYLGWHELTTKQADAIRQALPDLLESYYTVIE